MNCNNSKERWSLVLGSFILPLSIAVIVLNTRMAERAFLCGWLPLILVPACLVELKKKKTSIFPILALVATIAFFAWKKTPSIHDNPSTSYHQKQELVNCGEKNGANCFVLDFYSTIDEYPFGLRYHFKSKDVVIRHLRSTSDDMVDNKQCMFLLNRTMGDELADQLTHNEHKNIKPQEICGNDTYSLFRLVSE